MLPALGNILFWACDARPFVRAMVLKYHVCIPQEKILKNKNDPYFPELSPLVELNPFEIHDELL